jgi:hypothetical protein
VDPDLPRAAPRAAEARLLLRPLLAALCLWGLSAAFGQALENGDLGVRTGATVTVGC